MREGWVQGRDLKAGRVGWRGGRRCLTPPSLCSARAVCRGSPLPCQGPWLLSVDRQDVQSLSDNAWNAAIASQLPALLVCALRLIARRSEQAS